MEGSMKRCRSKREMAQDHIIGYLKARRKHLSSRKCSIVNKSLRYALTHAHVGLLRSLGKCSGPQSWGRQPRR